MRTHNLQAVQAINRFSGLFGHAHFHIPGVFTLIGLFIFKYFERTYLPVLDKSCVSSASSSLGGMFATWIFMRANLSNLNELKMNFQIVEYQKKPRQTYSSENAILCRHFFTISYKLADISTNFPPYVPKLWKALVLLKKVIKQPP